MPILNYSINNMCTNLIFPKVMIIIIIITSPSLNPEILLIS